MGLSLCSLSNGFHGFVLILGPTTSHYRVTHGGQAECMRLVSLVLGYDQLTELAEDV